MQLEPNFWQTKSLLEMTESEWEALCDGCGKCCYRKYIQGRGKRQKLYYTRIACNLLDVETGKCGNYSERFKIETDCTKLTKKNLPDFHWLPDTCAYRLLYEGKTLPEWHPLISGHSDSVISSRDFVCQKLGSSCILDCMVDTNKKCGQNHIFF